MAGRALTISRGLTLVELLVVVTIIGTVCGLVFVSTAEVGERQRLEGALRRIADTYAAARASAICTRRPVEVVYDLERNRVVIGSSSEKTPPFEVEFDGSVALAGLSPSEDDKTLMVTVSPTGRGRSHVVTMTCRGRLRGTVAVDGLTGRAEISVAEEEAVP